MIFNEKEAHMLIPLIICFILAVRVKIISNEFDVNKTVPMIISVGSFIVFAILSAGLIRVRQDQIVLGILLGIFMYVAVAAVLYGIVYVWIKQSHLKKTNPVGKKTEDRK